VQAYRKVNGRASVLNATKTGDLIAAISGKQIVVQQVHLAVTAASSGGTGIVTLRDGTGGTVLWQATAAAVANFNIQLSADPTNGYPLTSGNALSLEVSGGSTEASAFAIATGIAL
jgi:hypothetical protein